MTDMLDMRDYGFQRVIKYRGNIDFDGLYKFVHRWLVTRDWDFFENEVKDRPPVQIYKCWARKKLNFYAAIQINLEFWLWEPKPVEVLKNGVKTKMVNGRLKIIVSGYYITDYDGDFEKGPTLKKIEKFLNDYILYHENLLKYFDYLDYYLYGILTDIKKYLGMASDTNAY